MKSHTELGMADALIMEDASSNQFILAANDGQLKLLEGILTELQSAQALQTPRDSRIYDLTTARRSNWRRRSAHFTRSRRKHDPERQ
jgi:hypothetical protein